MDANDWILMDPVSGFLMPWPCEYTLRDHGIKKQLRKRDGLARRGLDRGQIIATA
jgi:hypothetical protein